MIKYTTISVYILLTFLTILIICIKSNVTGENTDQSEPQPLLLYSNEAIQAADAFLFPKDDSGVLELNTNDKIILACPGNENTVLINNGPTHRNSIEVSCQKDLTFLINAQTSFITSINCAQMPQAEARYTNKFCSGQFKEIAIGFQVSSNRFIKQLSICYNDILQTSLYTQEVLSSAIDSRVNSNRPNFTEGEFYSIAPYDLNALYSRATQRRTINGILGLAIKDKSVIKDGDLFFLSRGHYAAKADFIYPAQQSATMMYVNTAPQWQSFNGGNWNTMEIDCRNFASARKIDLTIITGSYGICEMKDENGQLKDLFLFNEYDRKAIPVPKLFFRVVYDPKSKAGVAFVGVNNPYKSKEELHEDIICEDICSKIKWMTWDKNNINLGYSYCCEVDKLRATIRFIPKLEVASILV